MHLHTLKKKSKMPSIQIVFLNVIHWFWKTKRLILCNAGKSVSVKKICLTNIALRRIAKVPINAAPLFWEWNGCKDCMHFNWVLTPSIVELYFNCLIALSTNININVGSTKPLRIKLVCAELHPSFSTLKM